MTTTTIENLLRGIVRDEMKTALEEFAQRTAPTEWVRARDCGVPATTLNRFARAGKIERSRVGRENYVRRADVVRLFESQIISRPEDDEFERALVRGRSIEEDYARIVEQSRNRAMRKKRT